MSRHLNARTLLYAKTKSNTETEREPNLPSFLFRGAWWNVMKEAEKHPKCKKTHSACCWMKTNSENHLNFTFTFASVFFGRTERAWNRNEELVGSQTLNLKKVSFLSSLTSSHRWSVGCWQWEVSSGKFFKHWVSVGWSVARSTLKLFFPQHYWLRLEELHHRLSFGCHEVIGATSRACASACVSATMNSRVKTCS